MGRIQSNTGLATGIDIQSTVDQLMAISATPRDRLQTKVKALQSQQVSMNELTALVIGIQLQSDRIGSVSNVSTTSATSSKPESVAVTSTGSPVAGNYSVRTIQTAQTSAATSNAFTSASEKTQAGNFVVRTGGFVDSSSRLDELRGGTGVSLGSIRITDRSGTSRDIDLRSASNIDDVLRQINSTSGLKVNAKVSGDRIVISDLSGQTTSNLIVEEVGDSRTAIDLGLGSINVAANSATGEDIAFVSSATRLSSLRDGRGVAFTSGTDLTVSLKDGSILTVDANSSDPPATVGQLIAKINATDSSKLTAKISADGNGIELVDKTTGSGTFAASGIVAEQLGWKNTTPVDGTISGTRVQSTLQGPLLSSLQGGIGLGTLGSITVTNRTGATTSIDLAGSVSLRDVIDKINNGNAGVTASLNRARTGIVIQDTTGGTASNLKIQDNDGNNSATKLQIAKDVASSSIDSQSLGLQFVSEATQLSKLNQGRGVRLGSFTITDSTGKQAGINLNQINATTVGDVLKAINDADVGVEAKLNSSGDGFLLVDTAGGTQNLTLSDVSGGSAALDLGIRGDSKTVTTNSGTEKRIEGTQTYTVTLTGNESLTQFVDAVNQSNGPITASLLTSGPDSVRVLFTSRASGEIGRVVVDGDAASLNVTTTSTARDAVLSVGSTDNAGGTIVRSSTNRFDNVITGLRLTAAGTSTDPVQITVAKDSSTVEKNIQLFVDQYNKVVDKIKKETAFDPDGNTTGLLFGNSEVIRVQQSLSNFINQRSFGSGKIQSLNDLGLSLNTDGKLEFDKSKLNKNLDANFDDVKTYLTDSKKGFGFRAKTMLDALVGTEKGVLVTRSQSLQSQIELSSARVKTLSTRLDTERTRLLNQFYAMEASISKIKNSANGLASLFASTSSSSSSSSSSG